AKLGEGGMGVVYRAAHATMGNVVVIKKLHANQSKNPQAIARFFQEARAAASINDPGIVRVFDHGTLEDGSSFIIMEYLEGESLRDRLRKGALKPTQALAFARQTARAVGAAHQQGIVHRD